MSRYNKAIGSLIGGVIGLGGAYLGLPEHMETQLVGMAITLLMSLFGTYIAPKNTN